MVKTIYTHEIELKKITIKNAPRDEFAKQLIALPYRGYQVESISDGRAVVITKPGGKSSYGRPMKEDFLVFIFNPTVKSLWQISHQQILDDIKEKSAEDPVATKLLIDLFEKVLNGIDPEDLAKEYSALSFSVGETPEALLKVYKWIWGQEDVNYPTGEGRMMSWKSIKELKDSL